MFDTITLRLHRSKQYKELRNLLFDENTGQRRFRTLETKDTMRKESTQNVREFIDFLDKKKIFELSYSKKIEMTSSHYEFNYYHNVARDFFEFEFSIPKYIFGTNVFQAIYHSGTEQGAPLPGTYDRNKFFKGSDSMALDGNVNLAPYYLDYFIRNCFFGYLFPAVEIDFSDVQINRLDICFNQVFRSKEEAMQYLTYQREIKKKYARESTDYVRDWQTAITYVGSLYSFKIYHKGSEFKTKGDRKELERINKEQGRQLYDVEAIQNFSDLILRYELTAHSKYLSYLHNHWIFRRTDPQHVGFVKTYNEVRSKKEKLGYTGLNKWEKNHYKHMSKLLNKRYQFRMETDKHCEAYHKFSKFDYQEHNAKFSPLLVYMLCQRLHKHFEDFQVHQLQTRSQVVESLTKYNQRIKEMNMRDGRSEKKGKLNMSDLRAFLFNMETLGNWEAVKQSGIYSERSLNRILARFKKIGFNPKQQGEVQHIHASKDFFEYHDYIRYNYSGLSYCLTNATFYK